MHWFFGIMVFAMAFGELFYGDYDPNPLSLTVWVVFPAFCWFMIWFLSNDVNNDNEKR